VIGSAYSQHVPLSKADPTSPPAMPSGWHWQPMIRVLADWPPALVFGRDIVLLQSVQDPRRAFIIGGSPDVRR
jgi:hypothetical protein